MDERKLVEQILKGDEEAFRQMYEAHKRRLEQTAIHFLGSQSEDLADVIQQTFTACLPRLKDFRFECSLYTWLNHFTVNFCFQVLNKRKKSVLAETEQLDAWSRPVGSKTDEPLKQALLDEIAKLDPGSQQIIHMKDIEGRTYLEISRILKLAPGTVMSRHFRARQELRRQLEPKKELFKAFWKRT